MEFRDLPHPGSMQDTCPIGRCALLLTYCLHTRVISARQASSPSHGANKWRRVFEDGQGRACNRKANICSDTDSPRCPVLASCLIEDYIVVVRNLGHLCRGVVVTTLRSNGCTSTTTPSSLSAPKTSRIDCRIIPGELVRVVDSSQFVFIIGILSPSRIRRFFMSRLRCGSLRDAFPRNPSVTVEGSVTSSHCQLSGRLPRPGIGNHGNVSPVSFHLGSCISGSKICTWGES